jgi:hypothetical protein
MFSALIDRRIDEITGDKLSAEAQFKAPYA